MRDAVTSKASLFVADLTPAGVILTVFAPEIISPNSNASSFSIVRGVTIRAPAVAVALSVFCPKEIVEKAKMATVSVKNLRTVVFIMNILNCFLNSLVSTKNLYIGL